MAVMTPRIAAALAAGALAILISPPAPASAHAVLSSSNPIQGAVVASAPTEVVLTFTESVRQVPGKILVLGPDGNRVDKGEPTFAGAVVTIPVDQGGNGTYLVSYRVISADSHPVAGGYTYSVGAPSAPPSLERGEDTNQVVATAIKVAKYLGYAGLVLVVGPVLVLCLLWPVRLSRRRVAAVVWTGMGLIGFATVAAVWLQGPYTAGGGIFDVSGEQIRDVLATTFGTAHLVRLGLLVAIALLLRPLLRGPNESGKADQILLLVLGGAALLTWPIAGHPAASPVAAVSVVVDAVHLASMSVWLGGLVMLVGFLLRQANERELGAVLPVWSRWAALAVSALVLAGTVQALIEVSTPDALVSTTYGRLILAKVGLLALVIAVAAYSRRLVRRRVAVDEPHKIRRAVWVELGITAVVLAMSAVLVQTTPARTAAANEALGGTADYYSKNLTSNLFNLQVDIDPATVGNNSIHLYAYDLNRNRLKVVEWKATAALPANDVAPIEIPLLPLTDNHATGELTFSLAGDWQLRFTVRISDIDQATVTATVPVT
ncbi:copper resistance CopC/CopD family protein [Micromonospora sp. CPCC 206061]|uniref:copper resistance CopC/CopD family protein n=1 Tax=Micromonospora sp. CPCC 206061 TaxID=3122410 RepID=UPI002FF0BA7F